jgi:murein DD-endopeptidase MepM/ murein hydrolase activator NlpD
VICFSSLPATRPTIATGADRRPSIRRKTLPGAVALAALCIATTFAPGVEAAAAPFGALTRAAGFFQPGLLARGTSPGAQPADFIEDRWSPLPGNGSICAGPATRLSGEALTFEPDASTPSPSMAPSTNERVPDTVCSVLESMRLLAEIGLANDGHQWSGRVTTLAGAIAFTQATGTTPPGEDMGSGLRINTVKSAAGVVGSTLREALAQAGFSADIAEQVGQIFAHRVDPDARAQAGDAYRIVMGAADGLSAPRIEAIEVTIQGQTYDALWFAAPGAAHGAYYTPEGTQLLDNRFAMPLDYRRISSPFGVREHPVYGQLRFHTGVDLTAPVGTPVYAAAAGTVEMATDKRGYGKHIVLHHADGYSTYYAHLSSYSSVLKPGQRVEQGQLIGFVGRTGTTTGPHLHFETRFNDRPVDPLTLTSSDFVAPLSGTVREAFDASAGAARMSLAALPLPTESQSATAMASFSGDTGRRAFSQLASASSGRKPV